MKKRFVGNWVISWCWVAVIDDHGDGTCTLLEYDRTRTPVAFETGRLLEDGERNVINVKIGDQVLKVRNSRHVFSYKLDESMISR